MTTTTQHDAQSPDPQSPDPQSPDPQSPDPQGTTSAWGACPLLHRLRALLRWVGEGSDVPGLGASGVQGITEAAPLVGGAGVTPLGTVLSSTIHVPELHRAWAALAAARLLSVRRERARVTAAGRRWLDAEGAPEVRTSRRLLEAYVEVVLADRSRWEDPFSARSTSALPGRGAVPASGWWPAPALDGHVGWLDEEWAEDEQAPDEAWDEAWDGGGATSPWSGQPPWLRREELVIGLLGRLASWGELDLTRLGAGPDADDARRETTVLLRAGLVEADAGGDLVHLPVGLRQVVGATVTRWAGTARSGHVPAAPLTW